MAQEKEERKGTFLVLLAALLYSTGGLGIKLIPWSGMAINGGRTAIAVLVLGLYLRIRRHPLQWNRWIGLGALSILGCTALFAVANKLTTAANAIVLQFTAPIFVILFHLLFWKKRPSAVDILACLVVCFGIFCFFLDGLEPGELKGNLLALLSGVAYAGVFLLHEIKSCDELSAIFWGDLMAAAVGLPYLLQEGEYSALALGSLVFLGVFQVALGYICLAIGLKTTAPLTASLISGIEPILSPVLVALFYGEKIGRFAGLGSVIVVGGVLGYQVLKGKGKPPLQREKGLK